MRKHATKKAPEVQATRHQPSRLSSALKDRGTNVRQWALRNGYPVSTAYKAERGQRDGVKTRACRRAMEDFVYAE